jgi:DNA primase
MGAHNGPVPTPADLESAAVKADYYRVVRQTLLEHLRGREVLGFGDRPTRGAAGAEPAHQVRLHINDGDDLDEAVRSGVIGFSLPALTGPGIAGFRLRAGSGTGIDTVATVALALAESLGRDGLTAVALTDGSGGLYLFGFEVGADQAAVGPSAEDYARALAATAPEIATTDRGDIDGRALVEPLPVGLPAPAPYSLVRAGDPTGVVVPLTLDEIAAASAGMPLGIGLSDVADRLAEYGDLAAALIRATEPSA